MPTGYTDVVRTGEVTEFEQFAMRCARAFGALIEMRDDPMDAKIVEFKPSPYHKVQLEKAQELLKTLYSLTPEQVDAKAKAEYEIELKEWKQRKKENEEEKLRYETMLQKAQYWSPPTTAHEGLKKFMIQQLEESIRHDCEGFEKYDTEPQLKQSKDWLESKLKQAKVDIDYHAKELRAELDRVDERNKWVNDLRESLSKTKEPKL